VLVPAVTLLLGSPSWLERVLPRLDVERAHMPADDRRRRCAGSWRNTCLRSRATAYCSRGSIERRRPSQASPGRKVLRTTKRSFPLTRARPYPVP
jgi:hypothetical protein